MFIIPFARILSLEQMMDTPCAKLLPIGSRPKGRMCQHCWEPFHVPFSTSGFRQHNLLADHQAQSDKQFIALVHCVVTYSCFQSSGCIYNAVFSVKFPLSVSCLGMTEENIKGCRPGISRIQRDSSPPATDPYKGKAPLHFIVPPRTGVSSEPTDQVLIYSSERKCPCQI